MKRNIPRRDFIVLSVAGLAGLAGCGGAKCPTPLPTMPSKLTSQKPVVPEWHWADNEQLLVKAEADDFDIVVQGDPNASVLRTRCREVPAGLDLSNIAARMEKTMINAKGVGLAGPQVGLCLRVATLMLDYKTDNPKTVFVRNPVIVERSWETIEGYEGCLSIPGVGGLVRRNQWIRIEHTTPQGEVISVEAEDYNSVLWQHELDHLDGVLYVDKLLGTLIPIEEVRRLRKEAEQEKNSKSNDVPPPPDGTSASPSAIQEPTLPK